MLLEIPIRSIPGQMFLVVLNGQNCYFKILSRRGHLFCGLTIDETPVFDGMVCRDRLPLKQSRVQPLIGNVAFFDTEGEEDPRWKGLGTRFRFVYFTDDVTLPAHFQIPIINQG